MLSQIKAFITWWGANLYKGLPSSLQRLFKTSLPRLGLRFLEDERLEVLWIQEGKQSHCGEYHLDGAFDFERVVKKHTRGRKFVLQLLLSKQQALRFQHSFPAAVQDNLRQVVGYQLDRLTPFTLDQVYYDAELTSFDKARDEVNVAIHVAPKAGVDALKQRLSAVGVSNIDSVSIDSGQANLAQGVTSHTDNVSYFSRWPLYFFLAALILSLILPLAYKQRRLNQIDSALAELRTQTSSQLAVREKLLSAEEALIFLQERRKTLPMMLDVVEQLSAILPNHTWLERLEVNGQQVQLRGESSQALSLIDTLEGSPHFAQVRFKSPVTRSNTTGKDQFHMQAIVENQHE